MFTLSRYVSRLVTITSLSGILLFVFILITGNAMRDILGLLANGTIPFSLFLELLWLLVPYAFSFAMPLGVLIGILLTMGRMSANQELTALKAAGISLYSIAAPVLFVALCGSMLAVYINTIHAPQARASYKSILNDLVRTDPLRFIVPRAFIHDFPGYVLYVGEKEEGRMKEFWLWELDDQKRAVRLLRAEEGTFVFDEKTDSLVLTLVEGFAELQMSLADKPLVLFGNAVQNQDASDEDFGYAAGIRFGKAKNPGSWQFSYTYQDLEADAVLGIFTDSDFGGGGTDTSGHLFKAAYAIAKNTQLKATYFMNEYGEHTRGRDYDYDRVQLDLSIKY